MRTWLYMACTILGTGMAFRALYLGNTTMMAYWGLYIMFTAYLTLRSLEKE